MSTSSEKSRDRNEDLLEWYRRHLEKENDKKEKLKKFADEATMVLIRAPDCKLQISKFIQMYEKEYDSRIYVSDYGFGNFTELFRGMPETFIVTHKHIDWDDIPRGGQIQLTESVRRVATADREEILKHHEKLGQFEIELLQLRNVMWGRGRVTVTELSNKYGRFFGRQFKAADYGFACLRHMLEFLPHIVKLEDTKPLATITWQHSTDEDTESDTDTDSDKDTESDDNDEDTEKSKETKSDEDTENNVNTDKNEDTDNDEDTENDEDIENDEDTDVDNAAALFAKTCNDVMNKSELIAEFAAECVELMTTTESGSMPFIKFSDRYSEHFERQCRATDYGFEDLEDLFRAIPDTVEIIEDKGSRYVPPHLRRGPGRMVQLTKMAALSVIDLPKTPDALEVVDVQDEEKGSKEDGGQEEEEEDVPISAMEAKAAIDLLKKYLRQCEDSKPDVDSLKLGEIDRFVTKRNLEYLKQTSLTRFYKK